MIERSDDDDDGSGWRPMFTAHTPLAEVLELAGHYTTRSLRECRAMFDADPDLTQTERDRAMTTLRAFLPGHVRRTFEQAHARLREEERA
jgi:hypothetical protein